MNKPASPSKEFMEEKKVFEFRRGMSVSLKGVKFMIKSVTPKELRLRRVKKHE